MSKDHGRTQQIRYWIGKIIIKEYYQLDRVVSLWICDWCGVLLYFSHDDSYHLRKSVPGEEVYPNIRLVTVVIN